MAGGEVMRLHVAGGSRRCRLRSSKDGNRFLRVWASGPDQRRDRWWCDLVHQVFAEGRGKISIALGYSMRISGVHRQPELPLGVIGSVTLEKYPRYLNEWVDSPRFF